MVLMPLSPTLTDTLARGPPSARVTVPVTVPFSWAAALASGMAMAQRRPRANGGRMRRHKKEADEGTGMERPPAGSAGGIAISGELHFNTRQFGEQHRRAPHPPRAKPLESLVRLCQRQGLGRHMQRHPTGDPEERLAVSPGEIGHRTEYPLAPEQLVGKRRDRTHVNPGAHD